MPIFTKFDKCMYVAKVTMATGGYSWSKKLCVYSTLTNPRHLVYDELSKTLYFTSDFANTYLFICKLRLIDGVATYCAKIDGDGKDYPY